MQKHMISAAVKFATDMHNGQFDKQGMPYIFHCLRVLHYCDSDDEELNCVAVLHDVLEDTVATVADLKKIGMTTRIIEGVEAMTKIEDEDYNSYLVRVAQNADARMVKLSDLRHNMDVRRLKGITEKDAKRLEKYARAYNFLKEYETSPGK